jgi:hypothetical protein
MPRTARNAPGGNVYYALNRAVARLPLFEKPAGYDAFERVLLEALGVHPICFPFIYLNRASNWWQNDIWVSHYLSETRQRSIRHVPRTQTRRLDPYRQ